MKKFLIVFTTVSMLFFTASPLLAAENSITTNPLSLMFGIANLDYEHSLNERFSLNVAANNFSAEGDDFELDGSLYSLGGKYYFNEAQSGSYIGLNYHKLDIECEGDDDNFFAELFEKVLDQGSVNGISLAFGYRKITGSRFTFDLGASMNFFEVNDDVVEFPMYWAAFGYGW
jgi:hypothetical protein